MYTKVCALLCALESLHTSYCVSHCKTETLAGASISWGGVRANVSQGCLCGVSTE